ncbi:hypothetical protein B0H13DRAFT_1918989 [Mycena leptocephala]|nr:hypothetical protein B0H13DRAFT_1918989 [Mycena leptocephala]
MPSQTSALASPAHRMRLVLAAPILTHLHAPHEVPSPRRHLRRRQRVPHYLHPKDVSSFVLPTHSSASHHSHKRRYSSSSKRLNAGSLGARLGDVGYIEKRIEVVIWQDRAVVRGTSPSWNRMYSSTSGLGVDPLELEMSEVGVQLNGLDSWARASKERSQILPSRVSNSPPHLESGSYFPVYWIPPYYGADFFTAPAVDRSAAHDGGSSGAGHAETSLARGLILILLVFPRIFQRSVISSRTRLDDTYFPALRSEQGVSRPYFELKPYGVTLNPVRLSIVSSRRVYSIVDNLECFPVPPSGAHRKTLILFSKLGNSSPSYSERFSMSTYTLPVWAWCIGMSFSDSGRVWFSGQETPMPFWVDPIAGVHPEPLQRHGKVLPGTVSESQSPTDDET